MKIQTTQKGTLFISIPKALARAKGWHKGQELQFRLDKGRFVLEEKDEKPKSV